MGVLETRILLVSRRHFSLGLGLELHSLGLCQGFGLEARSLESKSGNNPPRLTKWSGQYRVLRAEVDVSKFLS